MAWNDVMKRQPMLAASTNPPDCSSHAARRAVCMSSSASIAIASSCDTRASFRESSPIARALIGKAEGDTAEVVLEWWKNDIDDEGRAVAPAFAANSAWLEIVMTAMDLVAWTKLLGFADERSVVQTRFATTALTLLRAHLGGNRKSYSYPAGCAANPTPIGGV